MKDLLLLAAVLLSGLLTAQTIVYVNPSAATNGSGSQVSPFNDIPDAIDFAAGNGGGEVIVTNGTHLLTSSQRINTAATAAEPVTIKPETPYGVTFEFRERSAFNFEEDSRYITLEGFEIDGKSYENNFWCVVAEDFWSVAGNPTSGGLAVIANGQHLNIVNNYLHDCYQKGVEIPSGRYINVHGNVISNIAQYSLSGGHGIMRQQKGAEYDDPDIDGVYRWDIYGNMVLSVEQRIYSWVPSKGFIEMVIDEGKPILIDDPKQTNGILDVMTARIKNNVVAFGAVDGIRLKSTPNLEVSNNSIYSEGLEADGISDRVGDNNSNGPNTLFTNFTAHGNAAQTVAGVFAIEIDHALGESYGSGNDPMGNTPAGAVTNNYVAVGNFKPKPQNEINVDITDANTTQLFVDPNNGDFSINPVLGLPAGVGVDPAILTELTDRATNFGVNIGWDGWITDHRKLSQTILDNIPGFNDCIADNYTVLEAPGVMSANYHTIAFDVVDGIWKNERNSANTQNFELNEVYFTWYAAVAQSVLNANGAEYERIRWGNSEVKQNQCFDPDWLTVSEITDGANTVINGYNNDFILDGDLLVDFVNYTPEVNDFFDIITAGTITTANVEDLFDRVLFRGYTPNKYSLEVVDLAVGQGVRLTILEEELPVELLYFNGRVVDKAENLLTWETARERDNDFFEIQRSANGLNWTTLGKIFAASDAENGATYEFSDNAPLSDVNFYRLLQVDFDGSSTLSGIVQLKGTNSSASLAVYPNPFLGDFSFFVGDKTKEFAVYGIDGRDLTGELNYRFENGNVIVQGDKLPAGSYIIRYNGEVGIAIKK